MTKTTTSLYVDSDILETAKELGINISSTLDAALRIAVGLPNEIHNLEEELLKHRAQIGLIEAKLEEANTKQVKKVAEQDQSKYRETITGLKLRKKRMIEGALDINVYNKMLRKTAEAFGKELEEIVNAVESASYSQAAERGENNA
jgi:post-segregation antitoxin (ccd killing protein)